MYPTLVFAAPASEWLHGTPPLTSAIGAWRLHASTRAPLRGKVAHLEVTPDLESSTRCSVVLAVREPLVTRLITGHVDERPDDSATALMWGGASDAEISLFGVGLPLARAARVQPKGTAREIRWSKMAPDVLRVQYEDDVLIFVRACGENRSALVMPLDTFILMQMLAAACGTLWHV